jgi:DNA-binding IclR family transcriptional regulator
MPKSEQDYQKYEINSVKSAIKVVEFLATGDILGPRSLQDISAAVGINKNAVYRILATLILCHWAEKTDFGFRLSVHGLINHLIYAQKYLTRLSEQYGLKVKVK